VVLLKVLVQQHMFMKQHYYKGELNVGPSKLNG